MYYMWVYLLCQYDHGLALSRGIRSGKAPSLHILILYERSPSQDGNQQHNISLVTVSQDSSCTLGSETYVHHPPMYIAA